MPKRPRSLARQEPERSRAPACLCPFDVRHQLHATCIRGPRLAKFTEELRAFNVCTTRLVPAAARVSSAPQLFAPRLAQLAPTCRFYCLTRGTKGAEAAQPRCTGWGA